jgi:NAD(P)-dependent dehydrogenase (short-subunit alcohol dehydrogenase family)
MQVNVVGPILCAKHAVRAMSTAHGGQGGSIVTIASAAAKAPADAKGVVPYEATKGAMVTCGLPHPRNSKEPRPPPDG